MPVPASQQYVDRQEAELIEKARNGNERAFSALVKRYQSVVYNYAHKVCRDRTKAEETLQDTFINVYQKLDQFDGRSKFSTWLYSIVTNNCLMKRRRRKIDSLMEIYDEIPSLDGGGIPAAHNVSAGSTPATELLDGELRKHLDEAILKLPMEYRVVFVLRDLEGKSTEETAQILKLTAEATKSRLRRARAFLRQQLVPYLSN
jgi:RNA polymerase sigma-70 factor (ECF subfamily)